MIEEFIKELQELLEYKKKYESAQKDKQKMSDLLFEYMMREYENTSYEDRCQEQRTNQCSACMFRHYDCPQDNFPDDIRLPIRSDRAWIPGIKSCEKFKWS